MTVQVVFFMLTDAGRGSDNQNKMLRTVKVKHSLYSRWKPVTSESVKMLMKALEAAVRFVGIPF